MLEALLINAAVDLAMMLVLCWVAVRIGDVSFIDAVWGAGMAALALVSWLQIAPGGARAQLLLAMTGLWGLRLGLHLFVRWRAHGEDPRYAKMLGKARAAGNYGSAAFKRVFGPQAVLLFLTSLPAQLGILASAVPAARPRHASGSVTAQKTLHSERPRVRAGSVSLSRSRG